MPLARALGLFVTLAVTATLGACGATLPQTASITNDAYAAGAAYPSTGATTPDEMPKPFSTTRPPYRPAEKLSLVRQSPISWLRARCPK